MGHGQSASSRCSFSVGSREISELFAQKKLHVKTAGIEDYGSPLRDLNNRLPQALLQRYSPTGQQSQQRLTARTRGGQKIAYASKQKIAYASKAKGTVKLSHFGMKVVNQDAAAVVVPRFDKRNNGEKWQS